MSRALTLSVLCSSGEVVRSCLSRGTAGDFGDGVLGAEGRGGSGGGALGGSGGW